MAMIAELFQFFLEIRTACPTRTASRRWPSRAHRVVCDYIAGMTDGFFRRTYEQTMRIGSGSPIPPRS